MNLNRQFTGRVKRIKKNEELARQLDLQCPLCHSHSQTIISNSHGSLLIKCTSCGNMWDKEEEDEIS